MYEKVVRHVVGKADGGGGSGYVPFAASPFGKVVTVT
jgi:hypothetical protein